jgi:hypothetical protein
LSLYSDAIQALRQVILLDERVRTLAVDVDRMAGIADLRDRVSRIEGMLSAGLAVPRPAPRLRPPRSTE